MKFLDVAASWINRYFAREDAIFFVAATSLVLLFLAFFGGVLAPVLTGLVIAFLLQGLVKKLESIGMPRLPAVYLVFLFFLGFVLVTLLLLIPLLWQQLQDLINLLPTLLTLLQEQVIALSGRFPQYLAEEQIRSFIDQGAREIGNLGGTILGTAYAQVSSVLSLLIYLVLVPFSVFFLLKDKDELLTWLTTLLPAERTLLSAVSAEMNLQLGNYVRGKFIEILIIAGVTYVAFAFFGLKYAALLSALVGLSVLIPFVGAALVTLPVFAVAVLQFGWSWETSMLMLTYGIIQFLDGNFLVPLMFSEVVDLHPMTIIVSILVFGGIGGILGVFFAIPLATLIKAVYKAWPKHDIVPITPPIPEGVPSQEVE